MTFLVIALGSGFAMAGAALIAGYLGTGKQDLIDHVTGQTTTMVLLASTLLGAAGYCSRLVVAIRAASLCQGEDMDCAVF